MDYNIMWITRDKDDNRLWIHPYSNPIIHTYTDFNGKINKRWVSETQFEINPKLYKELTFENSPQQLKLYKE